MLHSNTNFTHLFAGLNVLCPMQQSATSQKYPAIYYSPFTENVGGLFSFTNTLLKNKGFKDATPVANKPVLLNSSIALPQTTYPSNLHIPLSMSCSASYPTGFGYAPHQSCGIDHTGELRQGFSFNDGVLVYKEEEETNRLTFTLY